MGIIFGAVNIFQLIPVKQKGLLRLPLLVIQRMKF